MTRPLPAAPIWIAVFCAVLAALPQVGQAQEAVILTADTAPQTAPQTAPEAALDTPEVELAEPEAPQGLQILSAGEVALTDFLWTARIVAVLADTPNDPAFVQQMRDIEARAGDLLERDVIVITDTDPRGASELRRTIRARGFMLAIIEKDGSIAQRRPAPRDVREIAAIIDRFPLRRQEMLERRPAGR